MFTKYILICRSMQYAMRNWFRFCCHGTPACQYIVVLFLFWVHDLYQNPSSPFALLFPARPPLAEVTLFIPVSWQKVSWKPKRTCLPLSVSLFYTLSFFVSMHWAVCLWVTSIFCMLRGPLRWLKPRHRNSKLFCQWMSGETCLC